MEIVLFILAVILFVLLACVIMVATNVLFDLFSATIIILAAFLLVFGLFFGLGVAIKNTAKVYRDIYKSRRGR